MSFAWNLKTLRTDAGLTQGELAKRIGVSQKTVSSWETGRTDPVMKDIVNICKALDCSMDKLTDTKPREAKDIPFEDILIRVRTLSFSELAELITVATDITEQRIRLQELQAQKERYEAQIEELKKKIEEASI